MFQMCFLQTKDHSTLFLQILFMLPVFHHCQKFLENSGLGHLASNPAPTTNELCDFGQTTLSQSFLICQMGKIILTSVSKKIK